MDSHTFQNGIQNGVEGGIRKWPTDRLGSAAVPPKAHSPQWELTSWTKWEGSSFPKKQPQDWFKLNWYQSLHLFPSYRLNWTTAVFQSHENLCLQREKKKNAVTIGEKIRNKKWASPTSPAWNLIAISGMEVALSLIPWGAWNRDEVLVPTNTNCLSEPWGYIFKTKLQNLCIWRSEWSMWSWSYSRTYEQSGLDSHSK